MSRNPSDPINIRPDNTFFVALCKQDIHSFVVLGVTLDDGSHQLLAAVGSHLEKVNNKQLALIADEDRFFSSSTRARTITYKAFDLKYEHYMYFLQHLKCIEFQQRKKSFNSHFSAFYPSGRIDDNTQVYTHQELFSTNIPGYQNVPLATTYQHLNPLNTCRKAAIRLTKQARNLRNNSLGQGISSLWFIDPPLKTSIKNGTIGEGQYLYTLPLPPELYEIKDPIKRLILEKLYARLDKIIMLNHKSYLTQKKFKRVKQLYNDLIQNNTLTLNQFFNEIDTFLTENTPLIEAHRRGVHLTASTATLNLFKEINKLKPAEFPEEVKNLHPSTT